MSLWHSILGVPARHRRAGPAVGVAAVALLVLSVLGGCADRADARAVSIYVWNESGRDLGYVPIPQESPPEYGVVADGKQTFGCTWRAPDWSIAILDAPASPVSGGTRIALVGRADLPAGDAEVWIHIASDGRVTTGGGVPGWWHEARQSCR